MRTVVIMQARLGSTRLPAKVLADLHGEKVMERLVRNLKRCQRVDEIVLAVPEDDVFMLPVDSVCHTVSWFRGSEHDVLGRYAGAAEATDADVIVRVTADSPLLDPTFIDDAISRYKGEDYWWEQGLPLGLSGYELISRSALDTANMKATEAYHREHVVLWTLLKSKNVYVGRVPNDLYRPLYRVCVDEPDDLTAVRAILTELGNPQANDARAIIALLDARPDLVAINSRVVQAS